MARRLLHSEPLDYNTTLEVRHDDGGFCYSIFDHRTGSRRASTDTYATRIGAINAGQYYWHVALGHGKPDAGQEGQG